MNTKDTEIYNLKNGSKDSEVYYDHIERFTASVMQVCEEQAGDLVDDFITFLKIQDSSFSELNRKEYLFEALLIGVNMQEYGGFAMGSSQLGMQLMKTFGKLRSHGGVVKKWADHLRGRWGLTLLMNEKHCNRFMFPSAANLSRLILWLDATAEFYPQSKRLKKWLLFFRSLTLIEASIYLSVLSQLALWFASEAEHELGIYTKGVNEFHKLIGRNYKNREDAISVNKRPVEYHLNMIGAVVMNDTFATEFRMRKQKVLLLPPCMRNPVDGSCKAIATIHGSICTGCNQTCAVNKLQISGKHQGFEVLIMHHASRPPEWLSSPELNNKTGVVGVACITNLITGGWTIHSLGIPAQCVVLDHCGCSHWLDQSISTSLNEKELKRHLQPDSTRCSGESYFPRISPPFLSKTA